MLLTESIYKYLAKKTFFRFLFSLISFFYRNIKVKNINKKYLVNIEGIIDMNINDFLKNRKKWISWVLRTRDWWKFLEKVVESFIDYIDELIIINNKSNDNTILICEKLLNKYWNKIKYYEYNYDILREENKPTNSIHSFAYYSNWSISKASYRTIVKIDDDNLFIKSLIKDQVIKVKNIQKLFSNVFCFYWWLNFHKREKIWVVKDNPYSWRYWDIGFFNISPKTYFVQIWTWEKLINNYFYYDLWFSYIHLKYFKKNNWLNFSPKKNIIYYLNILKTTDLVSSEIYTKRIKMSNVLKIIKDLYIKK